MADEIDFANLLIEGEVSRAVSKMRQMNAQHTEGSPYCTKCGDPIPEGRRQLGFNLCVPCVEQVERKKSLFAD
jgi:RNA polymerase-binding transcription factor DksA